VCLLNVTDNETKSSEDVVPQQPSLSASALLKEHEQTMKARNSKKRSHETSYDACGDDHRLTTDKSQSSSSDGLPSSSVESSRVRHAAVTDQQHDRSSRHVEQEPGETLKQVVKPELGRGLNVSCNGFVELDDIPCSSVPSVVTADSAKVS